MTKQEQLKGIEEKYQKHWLFVGQDLLDSLDHLIDNPPTHTIMNTGTLSNDVVNLVEDFKAGYPVHDEFQRYLENKLVTGNVWDFLDNPKNAIKDAVWTTERNKEYKWEAYIKYDYTPGFQRKILDTLKEIKTDMTLYQKTEKLINAEEKAEQEQALKEFEVKILKRSTKAGGEGGADPFALVRITDPKTHESAKFNCRNLFDFGYVINPEMGGMASNVERFIAGNLDTEEEKQAHRKEHPTTTGWGWNRDFLDGENWIEMTDFEIRAITYLSRFSPIATGLRM